MLGVHRLRLLVELSRRGTIAAVALALHMSASGISHQLSLLEREAGVPLLERVGRGVQLTHAGQRLVDYAVVILASLEEAETALRSDSGQPNGTCRVAAFGSAARTLAPAVVDCQRRHAGLRVELVEAEPEVAIPVLLSGGFDLVVSEEYPGSTRRPPRHTHREPLTTDRLEIVVSNELLAGEDLTRIGGSIPWALEPVGAASRAWAVEHCRRLGFTPDVQYESWDLDLLLTLVEHGAAASLLPRLVLPEGTALARLDTGQARTLVSLVRKARQADPSVRAVRAAFSRGFEESAAGLTGRRQ